MLWVWQITWTAIFVLRKRRRLLYDVGVNDALYVLYRENDDGFVFSTWHILQVDGFISETLWHAVATLDHCDWLVTILLLCIDQSELEKQSSKW